MRVGDGVFTSANQLGVLRLQAADRAALPVANALRAYLDETGIAPRVAAAALGLARSSMYRYLKPLDDAAFRLPSQETIWRIYIYTGGMVRPDHWHGLAVYGGGSGVEVATDAA